MARDERRAVTGPSPCRAVHAARCPSAGTDRRRRTPVPAPCLPGHSQSGDRAPPPPKTRSPSNPSSRPIRPHGPCGTAQPPAPFGSRGAAANPDRIRRRRFARCVDRRSPRAFATGFPPWPESLRLAARTRCPPGAHLRPATVRNSPHLQSSAGRLTRPQVLSSSRASLGGRAPRRMARRPASSASQPSCRTMARFI